MTDELRAAEFFAGIGLMRAGLEEGGIATVWANDIEPAKGDMYAANFGADEFVLADIRDVHGRDIPDVDLATASFPCTDLSLAGARRGLGRVAADREDERGSSMFWEFARVIREMRTRRPPVILLENVLGFASSNGGRDLRDAVLEVNRLGYSCDLVALDARHFVPQSRPRLFLVGVHEPAQHDVFANSVNDPRWLSQLVAAEPRARLHRRMLPSLPAGPTELDGVVDRFDPRSREWWDDDRVGRFVASLSPINAARLADLKAARHLAWRTAYRRTRHGRAVWEIRADGIAGCLRTARGGSSKQAVVEAGRGEARVRWLTPREHARLMGAPSFILSERKTQVHFGFGDAVCVPLVGWLSVNYLAPEIRRLRRPPLAAVGASASTRPTVPTSPGVPRAARPCARRARRRRPGRRKREVRRVRVLRLRRGADLRWSDERAVARPCSPALDQSAN